MRNLEMPVARHDSFLQVRAQIREHAVARGELAVEVVQLVAGVFQKQQPADPVAEREEIDEDHQEEDTNLNTVVAKQFTLERDQERRFTPDPEDGEQDQK